MDNVRDLQDAMQREILALDVSRSIVDIAHHQKKAEEMKCQLDEMLLLLKVGSVIQAHISCDDHCHIYSPY